jgi:hypothetical protein
MTWTGISIHGTDHLIFLNQERYFGIKNQGMIQSGIVIIIIILERRGTM